MPSFTVDGRTLVYAEEYEVLAFANKIREAGGADPLEALMPSTPGNPESCLVANALNFGCQVAPRGTTANGETQWVMHLPKMDADRVLDLAAEVNCQVGVSKYEHWDESGNSATMREAWLVLPQLIGNAAYAFDAAKTGWTLKYRERSI